MMYTKLSDNWVIRFINGFLTLNLIAYVIYFIVMIISAVFPGSNHSVKGYETYNVSVRKPSSLKITKHSVNALTQNVYVDENKTATVSVVFKNQAQLFSFPAIAFKISKILELILTGAIILGFKLFFKALSKDEVFSRKNANLLIGVGLLLVLKPMLGWVTQELLIMSIETLKLNDSGYILSNGTRIVRGETGVGLIIFAIGFVFRVGVNIKQENESFV